jgi:predicted nucleic acid-binding protein
VDRLFLDACVVFSAAYTPASPLRQLWKFGEVALLASPLVLEEARRNLAVLRPDRLGDLGRLAEKLELVTASLTPVPPEAKRVPAKDLPILLAALTGRATHLLTVDKKHFGALFGKAVGPVLILPPGEYLRRRG